MLSTNCGLQLTQSPIWLLRIFARDHSGPKPILDGLIRLGTVKAKEQPIDGLLVNILASLGILLPFCSQFDSPLIINTSIN